jgi:hypothetical protein
MSYDRSFAVAVTALLAVGLLASVALTGALATPDPATAHDDTTQQATTGQQLSTVIAVTDDDVRTDFQQSAVESALASGNESERAAALAERASELQERSSSIVHEYENATAAYENGTTTQSEYAQRLSILNARALNVRTSIAHIQTHADSVNESALNESGYDAEGLANTDDELSTLYGTGLSALFEQYTGETNGEFSLDVDEDRRLSVEIEHDSDDRSREVERRQPGNGSIEIGYQEALDAARTPLSGNGTYHLTDVKIDRFEGSYEFRFEYRSDTEVGEARIDVDGQTGEVFTVEEEYEPRDDTDPHLTVNLVEGVPEPGASVTAQVTGNGSPVEGATIRLNSVTVGQTDANGTIDLSFPDGNVTHVKIDARDGEAEGELEFEFENSPDDDDREQEHEDEQEGEHDGKALDIAVVDGTPAPGAAVTLEVTMDGDPVNGASVTVNDESAGETDENGTISLEFPNASSVDIDVDYSDAEGEREFEFENEREDERENQFHDKSLGIEVVDGTATPGQTITIRVTLDGTPVSGASVLADNDSVGQTDSNGEISVDLAANQDTDIDVNHRDAEGELEIEYESPDDDGTDDDDGGDDDGSDDDSSDDGSDDDSSDDDGSDDDSSDDDSSDDDGSDDDSSDDDSSDDDSSDDDTATDS